MELPRGLGKEHGLGKGHGVPSGLLSSSLEVTESVSTLDSAVHTSTGSRTLAKISPRRMGQRGDLQH